MCVCIHFQEKIVNPQVYFIVGQLHAVPVAPGQRKDI